MSENNENLKLIRQIESVGYIVYNNNNLFVKVKELDRENKEIDAENKKMQETIGTLKLKSERVNQLETENLELEGKHHKVSRVTGKFNYHYVGLDGARE